MEKYLDESELKFLRDQGVILNSEVALEIGDLLVAEDVLRKTRRIIEKSNRVKEGIESKRLLKG